MRFINRWGVALAAAAALTGAPAAMAQDSLVIVNVANVANNIAKNISVDVSQIPLTVQAPISVAANVCGVAVGVLSQQATGATCTATSTSSALEEIVQRQVKGTEQK